jgi:integrating conjugative element protein (TIGR03757 family)
MRVGTYAVLLVAAWLMPTVDAVADEIWVFTDHHHTVSALPGTRVIYLDAPADLKRELSASLPPDRTRAEALARERLRQGGSVLQRQLALAYQGVTDAWMLGITKIPAVVVDRRYVVYGEANVRRAVVLVQDYRRMHP